MWVARLKCHAGRICVNDIETGTKHRARAGQNRQDTCLFPVCLLFSAKVEGIGIGSVPQQEALENELSDSTLTKRCCLDLCRY
mmetsp:Transcript_9979/g.20641  ORF Transcript_9979/g.20641 Transcript_9979/m.20641 type:complete len:83 (+) Transcript_9979:131-379(+)